MQASWDAFLHLHSGHALPYADIVALYRALPSPRRGGSGTRKSGPNPITEARKTTDDDQGDNVTARDLLAMYGATDEPCCAAPMPLAWSEFVRAYGGRNGLSPRDLMALHARQKRAWTPIAPYPPRAPAPPAAAPHKQDPESRQELPVEKETMDPQFMDARRYNAWLDHMGAELSSMGARTPASSTNNATAPSPVAWPPATQPSSTRGGFSTATVSTGNLSTALSRGQSRSRGRGGGVFTGSRTPQPGASATAATLPPPPFSTANANSSMSMRRPSGTRLFTPTAHNPLISTRTAASNQETTAASPFFTLGVEVTKSSAAFRKDSEASRMLFDTHGRELSYEEVRAIQYELQRTKVPHMKPRLSTPGKTMQRVDGAVSPKPVSPVATVQLESERDGLFAAYPPSTELLPFVNVLLTVPSHTDHAVRANQRFVERPSNTSASRQIPVNLSQHASFATPRRRLVKVNSGARRATASTCKTQRAVFPPSARSLPWEGVREAARLGAMEVLMAFESLCLSDPSLTSDMPTRLVDPELMLFPLSPRTLQDHDKHDEPSPFDEPDDADSPLDVLIKSGRELSRVLSKVYRAPQPTVTVDTDAPEEPPELEGSNHVAETCTETDLRGSEGLAVHSNTHPDHIPSPGRALELLPNRQMLMLAPAPGEGLPAEVPLHKCSTGMLDSGECVSVSLVHAPSDDVQAEFYTHITSLVRATTHKSSVRVFGAVIYQGTRQVGIVTERLDAWSRLTHTKALPEARKLELLIRIAEAVGHIHDEGVAHGDVKPDHVMVSRASGEVKLARPGFARVETLVASTNHATLNGSFPECFFVNCTPAYAAPEVLQGELSKSDTRGWMQSDIYALTVILAEILLGRRPWEGETPMYVWNAVTKRECRPFDARDICIQDKPCRALETLVRRGWHQDPSKRPSGNELAQSLCAALDRLTTHHEPQAV